ncbi:MAG: hypothetical protein Q8920_02005 [Bacillota bacterium]|nr:hypothetical protein [Bacillota bacterium]
MNELKLLDIFLLPKSFYQGIKSKRSTLYIAFILVGINDLLPYISQNSHKLFTGKSSSVVTTNILVSTAFIIFLGLIDAFLFCKPLGDLLNRISKKDVSISGGGNLVKLIKIYTAANVLILLINIVSIILGGGGSGSTDYTYSPSVLDTLVNVWFCAIIVRGAGVVYKLEGRNKIGAFIAVYAWSLLLLPALSFISSNLYLPLLK